MLLSACASEPASDSGGLRAVTAVPTIDRNSTSDMCSAVTIYWQDDWPLVVDILETLDASGASCGDDFDIDMRLYDAYLGYGDLLQNAGRDDEATIAYQSALEHNPLSDEVVARLASMRSPTAQPPPTCDQTIVNNALSSIEDYIPTQGDYVRLTDGKFTLFDAPFSVYGVNYYPRDYPETRFLTEMNVESIAFELDLLNASGINTLRLLLRHDDLFMCPGNGAIPVVENVTRLDGLIHKASERGLKLILVLNHDADLMTFPLYDMPLHTAEQIAFIASRYSLEPGVLAYDLRGRGDVDYTEGSFNREQVLGWLASAGSIVRQNAPEQLITAGWDDDSTVTAPLVDFVSFEHFGDIDSLRQEIAGLTAVTRKPIVLAAAGFNTFEMDEIAHRDAIQRLIEAVERNGLAGWVIWTAFDYPLALLCPECEDAPRYRYGLWNTSYFPKRAVTVIELATGRITQEEINND